MLIPKVRQADIRMPEPVVEAAPASSMSFIDDAEMPTAQIRRVRRVKPAEWGDARTGRAGEPARARHSDVRSPDDADPVRAECARHALGRQPGAGSRIPSDARTPPDTGRCGPLPGGLERGNLLEEGSPARAGGRQEAPQAVGLGQAPQEAQRGCRLARARNR